MNTKILHTGIYNESIYNKRVNRTEAFLGRDKEEQKEAKIYFQKVL